jgi:hypothetical protein
MHIGSKKYSDTENLFEVKDENNMHIGSMLAFEASFIKKDGFFNFCDKNNVKFVS